MRLRVRARACVCGCVCVCLCVFMLGVKKGEIQLNVIIVFSVRNVYLVNPVCVFSVINSRQSINVIWQLSNDVNFINERKQKTLLASISFTVPPFSCSMIKCEIEFYDTNLLQIKTREEEKRETVKKSNANVPIP